MSIMTKSMLHSKEVEQFCKMKIDIPFESKEKAQLVLDVLKVDLDSAEQQSEHHHAKEQIYLEDNILFAQYTADTPKSLRSCASSFYDKLILITDLMKEFSAENPTNI